MKLEQLEGLIGFRKVARSLAGRLGGWVIAHGFGFSAPNWAGELISLGALLLAIASGLLDRRSAAVPLKAVQLR